VGVKIAIESDELPRRYRGYSLLPSRDGVSASVYLLGERYVLKLFGKETPDFVIENEIALLEAIEGLAVPKVVDRFEIRGRPALIFTQIGGESPVEPTLEQIGEIGRFLRDFHRRSRRLRLSVEIERFGAQRLKEEIEELLSAQKSAAGLPGTQERKALAKRQIPLQSEDGALILRYGMETPHSKRDTESMKLFYLFHRCKIPLKKEGVIHGDLFPDNCKFIGSRLSGVYDFSDICVGDFHFDLGVAAASWCFEGERFSEAKVRWLLEAYASPLELGDFLAYIRYALLYYAVMRYRAGRDYRQLLRRLEGVG